MASPSRYENKAFENETTDGALLDSKFSGYEGNFISSISLCLEEKNKKATDKSKTLDSSTKFSDNAMNPTTPELSKSQYSLVSTGELTAEALQVWLKLPKRIKYDPELEQFQKQYESDIASQQEEIPLKAKNGTAPESKRLPSVKSAPHLYHDRVLEECASKIDGVSFLVPDEDSQRHPPYFFQDADVLTFGKKDKSDNIKDNVTSNEDDKSGKGSKFALFRHYLKMTALLTCWVFFTLVFMLYNEKEVVTRLSSVNPGEIKSYMLNISDNQLTILTKISGPFITEQAEKNVNNTQLENAPKILVWLEYWATNTSEEVNATSTQISQAQTLLLQDDLDFNTGEPRSVTLSLRPMTNHSGSYVLRMRNTAGQVAPVTLSYTVDPTDPSTGVIYSCVLLCGLYAFIIFEIINRTMAAVIVSTASLAVLAMVGERPTLPEVVSWLDVETLLLLFSMMILVAIMAETGMFDYLAVFTFEVTKGKLWPLITLLCAITALLSTFLDNVTTVLLMTPVTIRLCEVMDLNPIPILMSMVLFSNIGGTATPVGDPPNVIIASNKIVVQSGINFTSFTLHMSVGIVAVCVQTYFQLRYMYRDTATLRLNEPREIQDLRHQISIWRRAIDSLPHLSRDQQVVRRRLERKMNKLTAQLAVCLKESQRRVCPKDTYRTTLDQLKDKYQIRDKRLLVKAVFAISFVVAVFFLHSIPELNRVSLGWTALLGAVLLLILADRADLEPILHHVEWSTLLFFAALFVLMEALSKLGLIAFIGGLTESLILRVDESGRLAVAIVLLLWVSGISSAFVDNIPLTTMMVRVVTALAANPDLGLPIAPLVWALSFGACLGGNGTLIGASANVVCAGVAEQHGYRISFVQFFKIGFPVMIGHLVVATGYLLLCHCVFTWH